jgi:hypothetical protein
MIVVLFTAVLWLMADIGGRPTGAAMRPSAAEQWSSRADASAVTHARDHGSGHDRKEGTAAVVVSVLGIIVVVALIVFLGSLSVRRRMRYSADAKSRSERGPPEPKRGLFG